MTMTLENALIAAVTTLAGAVTTLAVWFKAFITKQLAEIKSKLTECEDDRQRLWERVATNTSTSKVPPYRRRKEDE